jgi:hypothetical protein
MRVARREGRTLSFTAIILEPSASILPSKFGSAWRSHDDFEGIRR